MHQGDTSAEELGVSAQMGKTKQLMDAKSAGNSIDFLGKPEDCKF